MNTLEFSDSNHINSDKKSVDDIAMRLNKFYPDYEVHKWLWSKHAELGGQMPIIVILNGYPDKVHAIIDRLDSDN